MYKFKNLKINYKFKKKPVIWTPILASLAMAAPGSKYFFFSFLEKLC